MANFGSKIEIYFNFFNYKKPNFDEFLIEISYKTL